MNYISYAVIVSTDFIYESPTPFPAVTICNIYPFDQMNVTTRRFFNTTLTKNNLSNNIITNESNPAIYQVNQILNLLRAAVISSFGSNSFQLGFSLESMLLSCFFNGVQCSARNFSHFYNYKYGNCYTFNNPVDSSQIKFASKSGPNSGLQLELFAGLPNTQDNYNEKSGFYVAVHNSSQLPLVNYEGFEVPLGSVSEVSISRTFYYKLDSPYSNCRKDLAMKSSDSSSTKLTDSFGKYSKQLCFDICLQQNFIIKTCGCSDASVYPSIQASLNETFCSTLVQLDCVSKVRDRFDSIRLSDTCSQNCPQECDTILYYKSLGIANFPTVYYFNVAKNGLLSRFNTTTIQFDRSLVQSTTAMIKVFYDNNYYNHVYESAAYPPEVTLGIIGN